MTSYFAYDHGLPCRNPHCKSVGKPHPNCRCYGDHAEGGDAAFCSDAREHNPDCEYFAEGGEPHPPGFIPDERFAPAEDHPPGFIPDDQFQPADSEENASHAPGFIPDDKFVGEDDPTYSLPTSLNDAMGRMAHSGLLQAQPMPTDGSITEQGIEQVKKDREQEAAIGSFLTGSGAVGLAGKAAGAIPGIAELSEMGRLGKVGATAIKGMISNSLIQGTDEVSKWMLGQGDPQDPVGAALAHIQAAGLFGLGAGAIGGTAGAAAENRLQSLAESKAGGKLMSLLSGFGSAAEGNPIEEKAFEKAIGGEGSSFDLYKKGHDAFTGMVDKGRSTVGALIPSAMGALGSEKLGPSGVFLGGAAGKLLTKPILKIFDKVVGTASKNIIAPVTMKILSSGETTGILDALNHAESVAKGYNMVSHAVDSLMKGTSNAAISAYASDKNRERKREQLDEHIGKGGSNDDVQQMIYDSHAPNAQAFAKGGEVKQPALRENNGVATHYPEQNILMNVAKGRISNYLGSLRPQAHHAKLAFDDDPDTRVQKKAYDKALDIANSPLSVLDEIRRGTVEPEHVKHFNAMYPELQGLVQRKITEKITEAQLSGKKPSYKVRQGLSMFMGTALSAELTPQNIQAAQAVFAQAAKPQQPNQPAGKSPKSTSTLSKSDAAYLTGSQALQKRAQKT